MGNRALARIKRTRTDVARIAGFPVNARWMRENLVHDTRDDLIAVHAPVLAVTGDKDLPATSSAPSIPDRHRSDLILFMVIAFGVSWASWFTAIGLGGPATQAPTVLPYLFGAFGPLIGALVIRIRRGRRGEPAPEHAVRFRRTTLFWAPLLLALASATVLSAALSCRGKARYGTVFSEIRRLIAGCAARAAAGLERGVDRRAGPTR